LTREAHGQGRKRVLLIAASILAPLLKEAENPKK
jgi:hypothetical protein